jgi:ATP-dependent RNA helicase DDX52/ROK1
MDILKILTRGISNGRKPAQSNAPTTNLPSAGNVAHPQLFHDDIPSKQGKKRKRAKKEGAQGGGTVEEDSDVSDIDYFAPKREAGDEDESKTAVIEEQASMKKKKRAKLMSEDDCRQILKSHRLKFTVLAGRMEAAVDQEKPTKKRRRRSKTRMARMRRRRRRRTIRRSYTHSR